MNLSLELLGICLVVPFLAAAFIVGSAVRLDSAPLVERFALPCGVAGAFIPAYILLPDWAELQPTRHWQWLPYLAAAAALVGPAGLRAGRHPWLRWLVLIALSLGTALLIVPAWPNLRPSRPISIAFLAAYLSAMMFALDRMNRLIRTSRLIAAYALTGFLLAGVLADSSIRFAQLAAIAAAAFAGCLAVVAFVDRKRSLDGRGAVPIYCVLIGGMAHVGSIEPEEPVRWLLLIPMIPLAAGLFVQLIIKPYRASAGSAQSG